MYHHLLESEIFPLFQEAKSIGPAWETLIRTFFAFWQEKDIFKTNCGKYESWPDVILIEWNEWMKEENN
jgi:hypothetical protein